MKDSKKILIVTPVYPKNRNDNKGIFVRKFVRNISQIFSQIDIIIIARKIKIKPTRQYENIFNQYIPLIPETIFGNILAQWLNKRIYNIFIRKFNLSDYNIIYLKFLSPSIHFIAKHFKDFNQKQTIILDMGESNISRYENLYTPEELSKFFEKVDYIIARNKRNFDFCEKYTQNKTILSNNAPEKFFTKQDQRQARKKLNLPQDKFILGFVGDQSKRKGYDFYQKLKKNYDDITFVHVSKAQRLTNDKNEILKSYSRKDMVSFYNAVDAILILSRYEGSSNVMAEAMACEANIIVNGADELVYDSRNYNKKKIINIDDWENDLSCPKNLNLIDEIIKLSAISVGAKPEQDLLYELLNREIEK